MNNNQMKKEWFVVRIGSGPSDYTYLAADTTSIDIVPDLEDARKYSDFATAERDAQKIVERNGETAVILKYTEIVDTAGIVNPASGPTNISFFDWLDTIDEENEFEKRVYASNLGKKYYDNGKHPDEFLGEIIETVEREFNES